MAFEHRLEPPPWLRVTVLVFAAAAVAGIALVARDAWLRWGALPGFLLAMAGSAAWVHGVLAWRRTLSSRRRLLVDPDGIARLHDERVGTTRPAHARSWLLADAFVALTLAVDDEDGRPLRQVRLLSGPATADADDWRRLRAWLAWVRRGGMAAGP